MPLFRVAACLAAWLLCSVAQGFSYVLPTDEALLQQSEGVLKAEVLARLPGADGALETRYRLRVIEDLAGAKSAAEVELVLPGNVDAGNLRFVVPGVPTLVPGGRILVFHSRRDDGALRPIQLSLGLFGQVRADNGSEYYVRALEGSLERGGNAWKRQFHAPRAPAEFEAWIRATASGAKLAPTYLRSAVRQSALAKYSFSVFGSPLNGPARWFQFDSGLSLPWTDGPGGQSGGGNSAQQLQQALAAWTDDPTSRIHLNYAGNLANPAACSVASRPSFSGHVFWNDPCDEIAGSFSCQSGGVLGFGGSFASTPGQSLNGQVWYPRLRARVVLQDGAGCFMAGSGGADGAELLTHEIGHTLAFGHSCDDQGLPSCASNPVLNDATMRSYAHGDGRGAVLGADDRAGAAVAYPEPNPVDTTPPTTPGGLSGSPGGPGAINLVWAASTDSGGSGLAGYRVERCQGIGCSQFVQVGTPAGNSFADSGLIQGTTHRYRVRAVDGAGNFSAYSAIVDVALAAPPCEGSCVFRNSFE